MKELLRILLLLVLVLGVFQVSYSAMAQDDNTSTGTEDHTDTTGTEDHTDTTETEDDKDHTDNDEDEKDHDEDELSEEEEKEAYKRKVEIEQESDKFKIKSELEFGDSKDKIEIEFEGEDDPKIKLKYKSESDQLEAEFEYKIEFKGLFEYVENGTVDGFQEDEEVSEYRFKDMDWNDLAYTNEIIDGSNVWVITASTTDGVFKLILFISEGLAQLENNATLTPNSLKIDVEIRNFPYTTSGASLALKTKIKTEIQQELKQEDDTVEEQVGFSTDEAQIGMGVGFFSWIENAMADGVEINVTASALVDASDEDPDELEVGKKSGKMYFSFLVTDAVEIIWDPKVGVQSQATAENIQQLLLDAGVTNAAGLPGFGIYFALFSLMISGGIISKRRTKNN